MNTSTSAQSAGKKQRPRWQRIAIVVGAVLVALIVIGAIAGPKKSDPAPTVGASTPAAAPTTDAATTTSAAPSPASTEAVAQNAADLASRPKPTDAQVRQIGVALANIQPEMAEIKATQIESWSDAVCGDIWTWVEGQSGNMTLAQRAAYRFNGGDRTQLTDEQGQQIVDLITTTYCHP